jgi:molybdate transport system substrate-binding protein
LTDVVTTLADSVEKEHNIHLKLNLASSGTLARQLKEGMPCDIYFSASKRWMDYVAENGLIDSTSCCTPVKNSLVLISPKGKLLTDSLATLPSVLDTRLSIGDPVHVPAGKYAVEALKSIGIYDSLEDRLLPAKDVRSALMVVELGEADFGIVYKTDAMKSDKVDISATFPDSSHLPIVYHAAIMKSSEKKKSAQKVLEFLTDNKSKDTWIKYGFQPTH